jgi:hypothetical protein
MAIDKAQRDAVNDGRFKDIYIHASQEPWVQFYPGIGFKLLRATQETGHWTVLLNCAKGSSIPRHETTAAHGASSSVRSPRSISRTQAKATTSARPDRTDMQCTAAGLEGLGVNRIGFIFSPSLP